MALPSYPYEMSEIYFRATEDSCKLENYVSLLGQLSGVGEVAT